MCVYSVCVQTPAASWQRSAIPRLWCRRASCLVNWLLFWVSCRRHRCLSERRGLQKSLPFSGWGGWRGIGGYLACFFSLYMISFRGSDGNMAQTEQKETRLVLFKLEGIKRDIMWFNPRPYWYQDYFWTPRGCWHDRFQHVGVSKPNAQSGGKCAWSLT